MSESGSKIYWQRKRWVNLLTFLFNSHPSCYIILLASAFEISDMIIARGWETSSSSLSSSSYFLLQFSMPAWIKWFQQLSFSTMRGPWPTTFSDTAHSSHSLHIPPTSFYFCSYSWHHWLPHFYLNIHLLTCLCSRCQNHLSLPRDTVSSICKQT